MAYVYTACACACGGICATIFSIGGKFCPVLNFTDLELHNLTLATFSYALLLTLCMAWVDKAHSDCWLLNSLANICLPA